MITRISWDEARAHGLVAMESLQAEIAGVGKARRDSGLYPFMIRVVLDTNIYRLSVIGSSATSGERVSAGQRHPGTVFIEAS
jgi:hypothetical protein